VRTNFLITALILGLLTAIGPFAIDMYLPALPTIGEHLGADTAAVQLSLMSFFIAMAASQIVFGPLSDMFGRKAPLYFGLVLYGIGGIGCALSPTIEWLIAFRFLQGVGACAGMVISRAVVRDLHTGPEAAQLMSLLMLVFSVSPILAPLTGSLVIAFGDWRTIFWVMVGASIFGLILAIFALKETRPITMRQQSSIGSALVAYGTLLKDPGFLGLVFIGAFGMASFMTYLANSSFILIDHYGLTPTLYSVAFSVNAVAFIGMSQLTGFLGKRVGLQRVIRTAVAGYAITMVALFLVTAFGIDQLGVMMVMLFVGYGFLGMVIPTSAVLALEEHGRIAGTASALMGTLQFATAAVVMGVVGVFFDGTSLPMIAGIAACSVLAFGLTWLTLGRRARAVPAQ